MLGDRGEDERRRSKKSNFERDIVVGGSWGETKPFTTDHADHPHNRESGEELEHVVQKQVNEFSWMIARSRGILRCAIASSFNKWNCGINHYSLIPRIYFRARVTGTRWIFFWIDFCPRSVIYGRRVNLISECIFSRPPLFLRLFNCSTKWQREQALLVEMLDELTGCSGFLCG